MKGSRKRRRTWLAGILGLLWPTVAMASEHLGIAEEPDINWWSWNVHAPPVGWFLINFFIFASIIFFASRKPIKKALLERHTKIKDAIDANMAALARATSAFNEARDKLGAVDSEVTELIERIKHEGEVERERIVENARSYAERMKKDTESLLKQEATAAEARLRKYLAIETLARAEQLLTAKLTTDDKERMVDAAIAELEHGVVEVLEPKRRVAPTGGRTAAGGAA